MPAATSIPAHVAAQPGASMNRRAATPSCSAAGPQPAPAASTGHSVTPSVSRNRQRRRKSFLFLPASPPWLIR